MPEVLQIGNSNPALEFKLVVSPNEWQKSKKQNTSTNLTPKQEKYKNYFQALIDELREKHEFTGARAGLPQSWYAFSSRIRGNISYDACFAQGGKVYAYVNIDQKLKENRLNLFDTLEKRKVEISSNFSSSLKWERRAEKRNSYIILYHDGDIELPDSELEEIREWHIENLLKLKKVFTPEIEKALETLNCNEKEAS